MTITLRSTKGSALTHNELDGNFTDLDDRAPNKQVVVNDGSQLPSTLADGTTYLIGDNVTVSGDITVGVGSSIVGLSIFSPTLTYTGTGTMFTGVGKSFKLTNITIVCPNAALIFDFTGTSPFDALLLTDLIFFGGASTKVGNFDNFVFNVWNTVAFVGINQGISYTNTTDGVFNMMTVSQSSTNASLVAVDFGTSTFGTMVIDDFRIEGVSGAVALSGLASNGNVVADSIATVSNCSFLGGMTALSGITVDDFRWNFNANNIIPDTMADALLSLSGNATETVISTINTPVKVVGTFVVERESHYTGNTNGTITYDAERSLTAPIDIVASIESASGTPDATIYVAINGSVIASTGQLTSTSSSKPQSISTLWQQQLAQSDTIEMWIENNSGTQNFIVNVLLRVR